MKKYIYIVFATLLCLGSFTSCSEEETAKSMSAQAYILKAEVKTNMGTIEVPIVEDNIVLKLPNSIDIENIEMQLTLSEGATISPNPTIIRDWSYSHTFTVTAASGDTQTYYTKTELENGGTTFPGSVRLGSQQEIDGFGSNGFTSVGDIFIYQENPFDPIKDFSALNSIQEIKGQLIINRIGGRAVSFPNLERLGSFLLHAPAVTKVEMPKLKFVADNYIIGMITAGQLPEAHPDFSEVNLSSLEFVGGSLEFNYLTKLRSLESLSNLTDVGKNLHFIGGNYESLRGIDNIKHIRGNFEMQTNGSSLEGFNIEEIDGYCSFGKLTNVTSLQPLESLKRVGGSFSLSENLLVTSSQSIKNVQTESIVIENFIALNSLEGFPVHDNLQNIVLSNLPKVTSLAPLTNLKQLSGQLLLIGLGITDVNGLNNLENVDNLVLFRNEELADLNDLSDNLKVATLLDLIGSPKITSLEAFTPYTSFGGLRLSNLNGLTSLHGLENLTTITNGGLIIQGNRNLTDISALSNVETINFYQQRDKLVFQYNDQLSDFCAVSDLLQKYAAQYRVTLSNNYYNPTLTDLQNDNCSGGTGGSGIGGGK